MVTKRKEEKKPAQVTPMVRGTLSGLTPDTDSARTIKAWCMEQGHSRGYPLTALEMGDIYYALWFAQQVAMAPNSPRTAKLITAFQHRLSRVRRSTNELLRVIEYDEALWLSKGEIEFLEGDDPRKMGFYLAVNPYISPEKRVYSPVGENTTDDLILYDNDEGKEEEDTRDNDNDK